MAVLDWVMPGKDGTEVCREVRARSGNPYIYLILLTSREESGDIVAGFDSGADDYLIKPIRIGVLLEHVAAQLRHGGPKRDRRIVPRERSTSLTI